MRTIFVILCLGAMVWGAAAGHHDDSDMDEQRGMPPAKRIQPMSSLSFEASEALLNMISSQQIDQGLKGLEPLIGGGGNLSTEDSLDLDFVDMSMTFDAAFLGVDDGATSQPNTALSAGSGDKKTSAKRTRREQNVPKKAGGAKRGGCCDVFTKAKADLEALKGHPIYHHLYKEYADVVAERYDSPEVQAMNRQKRVIRARLKALRSPYSGDLPPAVQKKYNNLTKELRRYVSCIHRARYPRRIIMKLYTRYKDAKNSASAANTTGE